jgi:hypothetical protein
MGRGVGAHSEHLRAEGPNPCSSGYISTTHQSLLHCTLNLAIHFNGSNGTAYTRPAIVQNNNINIGMVWTMYCSYGSVMCIYKAFYHDISSLNVIIYLFLFIIIYLFIIYLFSNCQSAASGKIRELPLKCVRALCSLRLLLFSVSRPTLYSLLYTVFLDVFTMYSLACLVIHSVQRCTQLYIRTYCPS